MNRGFITFIAILILSCNASQKPDANSQLWAYHPKNNQTAFDNACEPLLINYQDFLKGVLAQDTAYSFLAAKNMATLIDSFPGLKLSKDTLLIHNLKQDLENIHAEIEGLLLESSWLEMHKAANMISIHLIHLLGDAGYKHHTIYIFNTTSELQEDGFHWLALTKNNRDPYHPNLKEGVLAQQILQEN